MMMDQVNSGKPSQRSILLDKLLKESKDGVRNVQNQNQDFNRSNQMSSFSQIKSNGGGEMMAIKIQDSLISPNNASLNNRLFGLNTTKNQKNVGGEMINVQKS